MESIQKEIENHKEKLKVLLDKKKNLSDNIQILILNNEIINKNLLILY